MSNKLLVIGLDGATFDLLDPLMDQGRLPNLRRLRDQGVWGRLSSTVPPVSVPAWPTFATGRNPGKTGMYDFLVRTPNAYKVMPSPPLRVRPFWEAIGNHGVRVGIANVPGSYPPRPVNGFLITGMMTPSTDVEFTYPPELKQELQTLTGGYKLDCERGWWEYAGDEDFIAEIDELIDQRFQVFNHLLETRPWDFLCLVITETDRFHHRMWKHIDPTHPAGDRCFADCFGRLYDRLDAGLGEILSRVGDQTNVVVMSDHGFGPCRFAFNTLAWLEWEGYLHFKKRWRDHTVFKNLSTEAIVRFLDRLRLKGVVNKILPKRAKLAAIDVVGHEEAHHNLHRLIDWKKTRAFALPLCNGYGGIFVNLQGRDPEGIVASGQEADLLLTEIRGKLECLKNPLAAAPLRVQTHDSREIYSPDPLLQPPDLIFGLDDYSLNMECKIGGRVFGCHDLDYHSGSHRPDGILIASGPSFKKNEQVRGASLIDLAPTFHCLLGAPLSSDLDGRVLSEILAEPVEDFSVSEPAEEAVTASSVYSEQEVAQIESRLKQLGYIE
jgi:predicted AlkP superfamily phosphohydrolase/phosphomutase